MLLTNKLNLQKRHLIGLILRILVALRKFIVFTKGNHFDAMWFMGWENWKLFSVKTQSTNFQSNWWFELFMAGGKKAKRENKYWEKRESFKHFSRSSIIRLSIEEAASSEKKTFVFVHLKRNFHSSFDVY